MKRIMKSVYTVLLCLMLIGCGTGVSDTGNETSNVSTEYSANDSDNTEVLQEETEDSNITEETEAIETEVAIQTETEYVVAEDPTQPSTEITLSVADIPAYSGSPYIAINDNVPVFADSDMTTSCYEYYSELDELGRCGVVYACIGQDLMPTEERGAIGHVKPTGWQTIKYDCVDGKYLYNRCHLIGYQLSGENANEKNLITGTRYMNVEGMLPFENMVADYVKETGNHVMYRVAPVFEGNNLLASGVQMEAKSVEDNGEGILFNVYCYNVQPQVTIEYASGVSNAENSNTSVAESDGTDNDDNSSDEQTVEEPEPETEPAPDADGSNMVWKTATGSKYHSHNSCGRTNPANATQITEAEAQAQGLEPCSKCF